MEIKPCKCRFTSEIFCIIRLEDNETKEEIKKREREIRDKCLKLCGNEDEAIAITDFPIVVIPKPCDYYVVNFLNL